MLAYLRGALRQEPALNGRVSPTFIKEIVSTKQSFEG